MVHQNHSWHIVGTRKKIKSHPLIRFYTRFRTSFSGKQPELCCVIPLQHPSLLARLSSRDISNIPSSLVVYLSCKISPLPLWHYSATAALHRSLLFQPLHHYSIHMIRVVYRNIFSHMIGAVWKILTFVQENVFLLLKSGTTRGSHWGNQHFETEAQTKATARAMNLTSCCLRNGCCFEDREQVYDHLQSAAIFYKTCIKTAIRQSDFYVWREPCHQYFIVCGANR